MTPENTNQLIVAITGSAGALILLAIVLYGLYKLANKFFDKFVSVSEQFITALNSVKLNQEQTNDKIDDLFILLQPKYKRNNQKSIV